jgi:hypothetical protein
MSFLFKVVLRGHPDKSWFHFSPCFTVFHMKAPKLAWVGLTNLIKFKHWCKNKCYYRNACSVLALS